MLVLQSTADLRKHLRQTIHDMQKGKISNAAARTRINAIRAFLDTLKVDIAAVQLGRDVPALSFGAEENNLSQVSKLRNHS